jgi:hypothetical protein
MFFFIIEILSKIVHLAAGFTLTQTDQGVGTAAFLSTGQPKTTHFMSIMGRHVGDAIRTFPPTQPKHIKAVRFCLSRHEDRKTHPIGTTRID